MIFELIKDFAAVLEAMPQTHPRFRMLKLLNEAARRNVQLVHRHPTTLFQSLWNLGWWYDNPEAESHYLRQIDPTEATSSNPRHPAAQRSSLLPTLNRWRRERSQLRPGLTWLRSIRPPALPLGSPLTLELPGPGFVSRNQPVTLSHDATGLYLANEATLSRWSVSTGQLEWTLSFESPITAIAAALTAGVYVVTESGTVLDVDDAMNIRARWETGENSSCCVAVDRQRQWLYVGWQSGMVQVWQECDGEVTLRNSWQHSAAINSLSSVADSAQVVGVDVDGRYFLLSMFETPAHSTTLPGSCDVACLLPSGQIAVVSEVDHDRSGLIQRGHSQCVIVSSTGTPSPPFRVPWGIPSAAIALPKRRLLAILIGSRDELLLGLWDCDTRALRSIQPMHSERSLGRICGSLAVSLDEGCLVTSVPHRATRIWSIEALLLASRERIDHDRLVDWIVPTPDHRRLISTGQSDESLFLWSATSGKCLNVFQHPNRRNLATAAFVFRAPRFSPQEPRLLVDMAFGLCYAEFDYSQDKLILTGDRLQPAEVDFDRYPISGELSLTESQPEEVAHADGETMILQLQPSGEMAAAAYWPTLVQFQHLPGGDVWFGAASDRVELARLIVEPETELMSPSIESPEIFEDEQQMPLVEVHGDLLQVYNKLELGEAYAGDSQHALSMRHYSEAAGLAEKVLVQMGLRNVSGNGFDRRRLADIRRLTAKWPRERRAYFQDACSLSMIAQERLVGAHLQLGQTADALKHGGSACFFAGLLRPKIMRVLRSGAASMSLARLHDSTGDAHDCIINLNRTIHAAERVLHSRRPLAAVHRGDLANLFAQSGELASKWLESSTAIQCYRSAVAIWDDLVAGNPSAQKPLVVSWLLGMSATLNILGHLTEKEGRRGDALEYFRRDVEVSQRIASADPSNPRYRDNLRLALETFQRRQF